MNMEKHTSGPLWQPECSGSDLSMGHWGCHLSSQSRLHDDEPYELYNAVDSHTIMAVYRVYPYCTLYRTLFFFWTQRYGYGSHHTDAIEL